MLSHLHSRAFLFLSFVLSSSSPPFTPTPSAGCIENTPRTPGRNFTAQVPRGRRFWKRICVYRVPDRPTDRWILLPRHLRRDDPRSSRQVSTPVHKLLHSRRVGQTEVCVAVYVDRLCTFKVASFARSMLLGVAWTSEIRWHFARFGFKRWEFAWNVERMDGPTGLEVIWTWFGSQSVRVGFRSS